MNMRNIPNGPSIVEIISEGIWMNGSYNLKKEIKSEY